MRLTARFVPARSRSDGFGDTATLEGDPAAATAHLKAMTSKMAESKRLIKEYERVAVETEGADPDALALPLSFLHHHARAEGDWRACARPERHVAMDRLPAATIDAKPALKQLPPLIKGYLRLGARFGSGAVIDRQFGTTDVLVILPVAAIDRRYVDYYGDEGQRYAA